jgi:diguanylate cyclase (GGDEF)-like protein/PAS domain S-box-containing protein
VIHAVALSWDVAAVAVALALVAAGIAVRLGRVSARARAAAAELHASRERYRALAAHLPDISVLVFDRDLRFTLIEGAALERHGWRREELEGRLVEEAVPAERAAGLVRYYRAALAGRSSSVALEGVRGGDYLLDIVPVRDAAGQVVAGMNVARDVTERKVLEGNQELLFAMLAELAGSLRIADGQGNLLRFDEADRRLGTAAGDLGVDPLDWPQHIGVVEVDGQPATAAALPLYRALHGEVVDGAEILTARGRRVHVSARPVVGPDGASLGAVSAGVDVTEHHDALGRLRESERRYRTIVDGVRDAVFQTDLQGRWTFLGGGFEHATGYVAAEMTGRRCWDLVHPDDRIAHARAFAPLIAGETDFIRHRHRVVTASGAVRWAEVRAQLMRGEDGEPECVGGVIEDVTDEHRAQQHGAAERAVLDLLSSAEEVPAAMPSLLEALCRHLDWDLAELWTPDEASERLEVAGGWRRERGPRTAFELKASEVSFEMGDGLPGQAWALRRPVWSPDISADERLPRRAEAERAGLRSAMALPIAKGREPLGVVLFVSRERREPAPGMERLLESIAAHIAQFVERARLLEQLRSTARTDPLTGLANRRAWNDELGRELVRSGRYESRLCLAMLDLDHFKRFNDARGHQAGDTLLEEAARAWSALLRPTDTLARYGGEEFAVLLPHCDTDTARAIVDRLLAGVPGGQTASCGIAEWDGVESAEALTARADAALYMAKRGGRAQAVLV